MTLVSEGLSAALTDKVLEEFTDSDHQYIIFRIVDRSGQNLRTERVGTRICNVARLNKQTFIEMRDENMGRAQLNRNNLSLVDYTMRHITRSCNVSMPKLFTRGRKTPVYWWTDEIVELRRNCLRKRRILTQAKRNGAALGETADFMMTRKDAISRSKKLKWEELRDGLNNNPWDLGYKLVMKKLETNCLLPELDCQIMIFSHHGQSPNEDIIVDYGILR